MFNPILWLAFPTFLFSIVIMWISMRAILSENSIRDFLSFFFLSITLIFYAGAIVFEMFYEKLWLVFEFFILISLVWISIDIRRKLS